MPVKEKEIEKLYRHIESVSDELQLPPSKIRFWDTELRLNIKRNRQGYRFFTEEDVTMLKRIKFLQEDKRLTLEGVARELKSGKMEQTHKFLEQLTITDCPDWIRRAAEKLLSNEK